MAENKNGQKKTQSVPIELKPDQIIDFSIKMRDTALGCEGRRQIYEWKFCILIWTAIGGLIGVLLVNKVALDREVLGTWQLPILGGLTMFIVTGFQICCVLATQVDKRRAEMYENMINIKLGVTETDKVRFNRAVKRIKWAKGLWSPFFQIIVTAVLLFAFGLIYSAMPIAKDNGSAEPVVEKTAKYDKDDLHRGVVSLH